MFSENNKIITLNEMDVSWLISFAYQERRINKIYKYIYQIYHKPPVKL